MATKKELDVVVRLDDKASGKLKKVNTATNQLRNAFIALGGTAVFGKIIKATAEFEKGLANVATLMDKKALPNLEKMRKELFKLSKESGTGLNELTEGLFFVVSAGVEAEKQVEFLDNANRLAVAGFTDLSTSIKAIVGTQKAYGKESLSSARIADLLFKINKKGFTTFEEIAVSIPKVTASSNALGVSQTELAAAMATLVGSTGNADEVATQLQGTFVSLMKPNSNLQEAIKNLGFETGFAAVQALGFKGTLDELRIQAGGTDEGMSALFTNVRALKGALPLAGAQSQNFSDNLLEMANSAGAVNEAFLIQQETFDRQYKILKANLNVAMVELGTQIMPDLTQTTKELTSMFSENEAGVKALGQSINLMIQVPLTGLIVMFKKVAEWGNIAGAALWQFRENARLAREEATRASIIGIPTGAGGTITGQTFVGPEQQGGPISLSRATGGPIFAGQPTMVGERGPEMIVPSSNGSVVPNRSLGGTTINISGVFGTDAAEELGDMIAQKLGLHTAI
jgi:TP901 family phage tail tape measure protein